VDSFRPRSSQRALMFKSVRLPCLEDPQAAAPSRAPATGTTGPKNTIFNSRVCYWQNLGRRLEHGADLVVQASGEETMTSAVKCMQILHSRLGESVLF